MDMNIALVGLILLAAAFVAAGLYLEGHQRSSRGIPVIQQVYRPTRYRRPHW
jgi:hypothetical protein